MFSHIVVHYVWLGLMMFIVAFVIAYAVYPLVLRAARVWKVYDNPDARKLQRKPIPVMGGVAVYIGILLTSGILLTLDFSPKVVLMLAAMTILLGVGVADDIGNLPVKLRFFIEIGVVTLLVALNKNAIDHFSNIFGIGHLNIWATYALSILSGVGIINAINLMDGVNGYSSGFTMMACLLFAGVFFVSKTPGMGIICMICAGAMLPFFLHNVFGERTKMFIGDGGTLMVGTMMTVFCFSMMKEDSSCFKHLYMEYNVALIPLGLAILGIPVFDTLRVMFSRMLRHESPFHPDKTHLHHLFIDCGFSHFGTTVWILTMNLSIVVGWIIAWLCGGSTTLQAFIVVLLGLLYTIGFYSFMRKQEKKRSGIYFWFCKRGEKSHIETSRFWIWMQKSVDDELFSEGKEEKQE